MKKGFSISFCLFSLLLWASTAGAFSSFSISRDATNCRQCHGDFRSDPYISLTDGQGWGDDLHDIHRFNMLSGDCDTCHGAVGLFPVDLDTSNGGSGLAPISCVGCHGRDADAGNDSVSQGRGAGLRQHHWNTGTTMCANCHTDANPANFTPVGEDVPPPYYFTPDGAHPDKPTVPCNPTGEEDFAGVAEGLDNDGDDLYDTIDPDCQPAECGNGIVEPGEECDDGNTLDGDCCSANCQFEAVGSPCPDGVFCNGEETCDGAGACQAGPPVDCNDNIACTDDSCDEANATCVNMPNDANCPDDGLFCNGTEFCSAQNDCSSTGDPCGPGTVCNEATDTCDQAPACGDGILDPGEECDDGNILDGDCCSANCTFEAAGNPCPDEMFCNGEETCDGAGLCQAGTPVDCNDGVDCTVDSCDEVNDVCVNTPNDNNCPDDGLFCNGQEVCDAVNGCVSTGDPCPAATICNEDTDTCDAEPGCGNGIVEPGEECDDGNTLDGDCCSADCTFEAAGSPCPDGMFCNGDETCDGVGTCQAGTPVDCDDGVDCTLDFCVEENDTCMSVPNDANCPDDGLFCNGREVCDGADGCVSTGNPCPAGITCNEDTDTCEFGDERVTLCHRDRITITVAAAAVPAHLEHGDTFGECPNDVGLFFRGRRFLERLRNRF